MSEAIEAKWGVRFTAVASLADGGLLEVRYEVLDASKAGAIHTDDLKNLPVIVVEGTGAQIVSQSVMFHFHHASDAEGRSYSIVYGNASGAVRPHTLVTLRMSDGLELRGTPVAL